MSRSFKHHPYVKDNKRGRKIAKRLANKKVRRANQAISNGKSYQKIFNSYDIHDYYYYYPLSHAQYLNKKYPHSNYSYIHSWYQCCYWK